MKQGLRLQVVAFLHWQVVWFSVCCAKGRVHVVVPGIPHPLLAGSKSEVAEKARQMALEGSCSFALAGGLVFSVLCKGRVVVRVPAEEERIPLELLRGPLEEEESYYSRLRILWCSCCRLLHQKVHLRLYCFVRLSKYPWRH